MSKELLRAVLVMLETVCNILREQLHEPRAMSKEEIDNLLTAINTKEEV